MPAPLKEFSNTAHQHQVLLRSQRKLSLEGIAATRLPLQRYLAEKTEGLRQEAPRPPCESTLLVPWQA